MFYTCIYLAFNAIACVSELTSDADVSCINENGVYLCVDKAADLGCYQDTFRDNSLEERTIVEHILSLNEVCGDS